MKKRDTYRSYLIKKFLGVDSTYYKPNPKFSRSDQVPMHLALVIDGVVEDIIHCDERLGYILLSEPKVIEIGYDYRKVNVSDIYDEDSNTFSREVKSV
jgi:hypothetical protein